MAVLFAFLSVTIVHSLLSYKVSISTLLHLTIFYTCLLSGMSLRSLGVELHCRCIMTESKPIGRHIEKVELIPANSHCEETEIM